MKKMKTCAAVAFTLLSLAALPSAAKADSFVLRYSTSAQMVSSPLLWQPTPVVFAPRHYCPPRQVIVAPTRPVVYYYQPQVVSYHHHGGWDHGHGHGHGYGRRW
jgi:hypothetical protein